ncbi:MAG: hypothetical protein HZY73_13075 [Micropruina sp.]|nr:MAG: hypothetical protein HZY73_13075 [Micropruina sp.]
MIENLKRIREPLAWMALVALAGGEILGLVRFVQLLTADKVPLFAAFQSVGLSILNLPLVLALVALVCLCLFMAPATGRAVLVARLAAIVVSIGTLLQLVCMILGVAASANAFGVIVEILGGLLDVAVKAVAAGALWILLRGLGAGRLEAAPRPVGTEIEPAEPKAQPVWRPEQATGTAWRTANEAAAGAVPSSLGDQQAPPSADTRWKPAPRPEAQSGQSDPMG